jgi:signal transduction histidine kinase
MEWILWELLENAKKFHPQNNPTIEIRVSPQTINSFSSFVIDDGVTLTPDQLTQAWLPYYQAEKDFTGNVSGMG